MIEKISFGLMNESGETIEITERIGQTEMKLEIATAELFSNICRVNNGIEDAEIKIAEKFNFALNLKKYLEEINQNGS